MSFFDQPPPVRQINDQRVAAWMKQKIHTHQDDNYQRDAQRGQDLMSGKYNAGRTPNKPRYVPGYNPVDSKPNKKGNISTPEKPSVEAKANNQTDNSIPGKPPVNDHSKLTTNGNVETSHSTSVTISPTNFAQKAPPGINDRVPASSSTVKATLNALQSAQISLPPHLRQPGLAPVEEKTAPVSQSSKRGTRAPPVINATKTTNSIKFARKFPCTYEDCDMGFAAKKAMKKHKEEVHHYCRVCDEDCEDFEDLLMHKVESENHICCRVCGEDFRSEAGRGRHERQVECKCVGCGQTFDKGSSLIQHIHENQCRDRENRVSRMVNREILKKQRAEAALHLDALSHFHSNTTELIAAMQPPEEDTESVGGVPIEPHLLDMEPQELKSENISDDDDNTEKVEDDLIDFSDKSDNAAVDTAGRTRNVVEDFPTLADAAKVKDNNKGRKESMIDNWNAMTINDPNGATEWDAPLSVSANDFENFDYGKAMVPSMSGVMNMVSTDWDHRVFKRHGVDNKYHCPFTKCKVASMDVDNLKGHLTSGIHQGTDHRCIKCLRRFKNLQGLLAHMESNSERCKIKETDHFGQILSVVSGGFLGVKGRGADGTIKIGALNEEELAEQAAEQKALLPSEDPNYDWNL